MLQKVLKPIKRQCWSHIETSQFEPVIVEIESSVVKLTEGFPNATKTH